MSREGILFFHLAASLLAFSAGTYCGLFFPPRRSGGWLAFYAASLLVP